MNRLDVELAIRHLPAWKWAIIVFAIGLAALLLVDTLWLRPMLTQSKIRLAQAQQRRALGVDPVSVPLDAQRFNHFTAILAPCDSGSATIEKILGYAREGQLSIQEASYLTEVSSLGEYRKLDISLPVKGTYPEIRSFVFRLLSDTPSLALADMSFGREKSDLALISSDIRFSLYQRPTP